MNIRSLHTLSKAFVFFVFFLAFALAPAPGKAGNNHIAEVTRIQGGVIAESLNNSRALSLSSKVYDREKIITGKGARIELKLQDGAVLTLGGDTVFSFEEYRFSQEKSVGRAMMKMLAGAFRFVTGDLMKQSKARLQVDTPLGTIGVRGTDFWGGYFEEDRIGVIMLSGKGVTVANKGGIVTLKNPGEGTFLTSDKVKPTAPGPWKEGTLNKAVKSITFD